MSRRVQIVIKQETNTLALVPPLPPRFGETPPDKDEGLRGKKGETLARPDQTLFVFRLNQVVYGSGLLRTSSDLTKVHVTRTDSATKKKQERTIDLTKLRPEEKGPVHNIGQGQDLWLREGDVIEIPDKP